MTIFLVLAYIYSPISTCKFHGHFGVENNLDHFVSSVFSFCGDEIGPFLIATGDPELRAMRVF